ncbi:hypothetical protein GYMLUDRAFT_251314 [Collybiopsis luxurians FD-317 M1]|uniref:Uncharacterized protein n=1 Tax=Collybiopsis luxurians FD-317 M1 TaxID=944289 RepID=A0A0D0CBU1_9AGAR|nr:hypothetical protein GYMLUDRAFT_251314 [Collybiopsis luxurians FD-317 M1]
MVEYITIHIPRLFPSFISVILFLSFLLCIPALVLSLLNHDREVEGLGITAIILTSTFHLVIIVWTFFHAKNHDPPLESDPFNILTRPLPQSSSSAQESPRYYTTAGTICAYALGAFWFFCFAINTQDIVTGPDLYLTVEVSGKWRLGVEIAESVMMGLEGVLAFSLAGFCTVARKRIRQRSAENQMQHTNGLLRTITNESVESILPGRNDDEIRERSRFSSDSSLLRPPPATLKKKPSFFSKPSPLHIVVNSMPATQ